MPIPGSCRSHPNVASPARKLLLRPMLLVLLSERDDHGYALLERLDGLGLAGSDPAGVYRQLRAMEADGVVRSRWASAERGPDRRVYALTPFGQDQLIVSVAALADQRDAIAALVERAWSPSNAPGAVEVRNGGEERQHLRLG